jgi:hypothetical protein
MNVRQRDQDIQYKKNANFLFPETNLTVNPNITITILDIIYCPIFHLEHGILENRFCLLFQAEHTQLGPTDGTSFCLQTPATTPVGFIKPTQHKPLRVNNFPSLEFLLRLWTST